MWKFDENLVDACGVFDGVATNNPTFLSPGIDGGGTCLYLNASTLQSVTVPSPPFLNMVNKSFTVSVWINPRSWNTGSSLNNSDNVIFAQNDQTASYRSLQLALRRGSPRIGFFGADLAGSATVQVGRWTHVRTDSFLSLRLHGFSVQLAFVYDYTLRRQSIYINGILHKSADSRDPYLGSSGDVTIGTGVVGAPNNFWDGCLDQMTFQPDAKK